MTPPHRRATDYTRLRHLSERAIARLSGDGWMARAADRLGLQGPPTVTRLDEELPGPAGAPPLRAAFASDFHAGPTTHPRAIAAACQALRDLRPDLLLLGGDFVSLDSRYIGPLAEALAEVPAPLGRFAVLGNHDLWAGDGPVAEALERAGVSVLVNRAARLPEPYAHLSVCGLDDPTSGRPDARAATEGAGGARLVLMHSPEGLAHLAGVRFDLALCGHTHGGQVCLPGGWPLWVPGGRLNRRYLRGRFELGQGRRMVVSRGVGYGGLPVRAGTPPEVTLLTIRWAPAEG